MASRTVLIGYSDTGRVAVDVLSAALAPPELVVVDVDRDHFELALQRGLTAVLGDGADVGTLRIAGVPTADRVIVAVADDASAMRITSAVRSVSAATIVVLVREPRWRETAAQFGADKVIVAKQIVGRLLGLSVREQTKNSHVQQGPGDHQGLVVAERAVRAPEVGLTPSECGPQVLAVRRGDTRVWRDDPSVRSLRPDDRLLVLRAPRQND